METPDATEILFSSLKWFFLANLFWSLPGVIPPLDIGLVWDIRGWLSWLCTVLAVAFFWLAFRKAGGYLRSLRRH